MEIPSLKDNNVSMVANFALKTYEFVHRFRQFLSEMTILPKIVRFLNDYLVIKLRQKNSLQDVEELLIPCLLFFQISNKNPYSLFKNFIEWKSKYLYPHEKNDGDQDMIDLSNSECQLPDELKRNIIKGEILFLRRYQKYGKKYNRTRRMLIDKLRSLKVSSDQSFRDSIIARIELLWLNYFDSSSMHNDLSECVSLLHDVKAEHKKNNSNIGIFIPIVLMWKFLTTKRNIERTIIDKERELSIHKNEGDITEDNQKSEKDSPSIGLLFSLEKDQEMLQDLQEAIEYSAELYLKKDAFVEFDPYVTKEFILHSLFVIAEALNLLGNSGLYEKCLQLLVKLSVKYKCFDENIWAIGDLSGSFESSAKINVIEETEKSSKR